MSYKSVPQEFPTRVAHKSVLQSVPQECPTRVSFGQISFSIVFAFGFVGSILFLAVLDDEDVTCLPSSFVHVSP